MGGSGPSWPRKLFLSQILLLFIGKRREEEAASLGAHTGAEEHRGNPGSSLGQMSTLPCLSLGQPEGICYSLVPGVKPTRRTRKLFPKSPADRRRDCLQQQWVTCGLQGEQGVGDCVNVVLRCFKGTVGMCRTYYVQLH